MLCWVLAQLLNKIVKWNRKLMPVLVWSLPSFNVSFTSVEYLIWFLMSWPRCMMGFCPGLDPWCWRSLAALSNHHKKHQEFVCLFRNGWNLTADLLTDWPHRFCSAAHSQRLVFYLWRLEKFHKVFLRSSLCSLLPFVTSTCDTRFQHFKFLAWFLGICMYMCSSKMTFSFWMYVL